MTHARRFGLAAAVAIAVALMLYGNLRGADRDAPNYRLASVLRGPIASTVLASGTLKAVVTVDVGTQVSGLIKTLHADFNSQVEAGQIIARIDSAPFEARLGQAEAELAVAHANVAIQEAALAELQADLEGHRAMLAEAAEELRRKRALAARSAISSSVVDTARAGFEQANAQVNAGLARLAKQGAQIDLARARVLQQIAAVQQRQLELDYTYIRSPINGVVIRRNVDAGQTVASSLQAPVLFRIAGDLARMEVNINIDEADIGRLQVDQKVHFTVDTYPDRSFEGRVHQIRKVGEVISNVVAYTVVASVDNAEHRLLPGMTATASIVTSERADALKVPNAALRLRLPNDDDKRPTKGSWVWVLDNAGQERAIALNPGISDGTESEIIDGKLVEGQQVIVGIFAPTAPGSRRWPGLGF